jgi:hypothetical protein
VALDWRNRADVTIVFTAADVAAVVSSTIVTGSAIIVVDSVVGVPAVISIIVFIGWPSPKIEEDMEFSKGLSVKQNLKNFDLRNLRSISSIGPLKPMLPNIDFFVDLHDDRMGHKDELIF